MYSQRLHTQEGEGSRWLDEAALYGCSALIGPSASARPGGGGFRWLPGTFSRAVLTLPRFRLLFLMVDTPSIQVAFIRELALPPIRLLVLVVDTATASIQAAAFDD